MNALTRTQRAALADLRRTGHQWPLMHPRYGGDRHTKTTRYARRTLQALVDAGVAEWAEYHLGAGVLPHVIPKRKRPTHQHERWQVREGSCGACGERVDS